MKAIIMAGGKGERLRPLTDKMPKPMLPMVNKPIIEYIIELLKKSDITDIAVTLGYKSEKIISALGDGGRYGVRLNYFLETQPMGTAGGVKNCSSFINEDFVVVSGDAFTSVDLSEMIRFHFKKGGLGTICVKEVDDVSGFGVVTFGPDGRITDFVEKPESSTEKHVNTGIYVFKPDILNMIPCGFYDFGRNLFPKIKDSLYAYETREYWNDIGTLKNYYKTNLHIVDNGLYLNRN